MSTSVRRSAEEALYKELKYRAVDPLEHDLHCLDVFTKVEQSLVQRVKSKFSSKMRPLMRLGSMLDLKMMAEESKWRTAADLVSMRKGLDDLANPLKNRSSHPNFHKKKVPSLKLSFSNSNKIVLWLASVAGIDLGRDESLACTMDGLAAASVNYTDICSWIMDGDWSPNLPFLEMTSSDWADHGSRSKVKKLWIVTEVLYATKFTCSGRHGLFTRVMAQASGGAPGISVDAGADIGVQCINESTLELKSKRNKHFIVGYRTMRVEYGPDGKPVLLLRKAEDGGLRGDNDNLYELNLEAMGEDIFEIDQADGSLVLVPLLTPTERELKNLESQAVVHNSDPEAAPSASI